MKVSIIVTHLLGTGHLRRAMMLAKGFVDAGHRVQVISGGTPVDGIAVAGVELIQLPPVKSNGTDFTTLLSATGAPASKAYLADRQAQLLRAMDAEPDVVMTELYPFGRRVLAAEFDALLDAAKAQRPKPLILCSIRDILAPPSRPSKVERTGAVIARYYDGVLVHSDAQATPLTASWPVSDALQGKLHYTGFVSAAAPGPHPQGTGAGEVLVSAGGGAVGAPLFMAACAAAALAPSLTWRLLIGGQDPEPLVNKLHAIAPANLIAEPARPDFRNMLNHAACSVSMAGYNTAMDLLQTGVPALLIPFDEGGEVEQSLRARSLMHLPGFEVLTSAEVTPARLAEAVTRLAALPRRSATEIALNGAVETVRITQSLREGSA